MSGRRPGRVGLLDILFPPACVACGLVLEEGFFCEDCELQVEPLASPRCPRCAEPMAAPEEACARCRLYPPPFVRAFAPFTHSGPVAHAIHLFKYEDHPELAAPLAAVTVRDAEDFLKDAPRVVCGLPLHRRRFHERRYDQAELLAAEVCRLTGRTHLAGALQRTRATRRQVGLTEAEREANVHGAFRATRPLEGAAVLLVDDVLTTGATARAAAAALREGGAGEIQVLAIARAHSAG